MVAGSVGAARPSLPAKQCLACGIRRAVHTQCSAIGESIGGSIGWRKQKR